MKSYEDTKDANEREPSPPLGPEYPEEVCSLGFHGYCLI